MNAAMNHELARGGSRQCERVRFLSALTFSFLVVFKFCSRVKDTKACMDIPRPVLLSLGSRDHHLVLSIAKTPEFDQELCSK
jgi:hypothetical protein